MFTIKEIECIRQITSNLIQQIFLFEIMTRSQNIVGTDFLSDDAMTAAI